MFLLIVVYVSDGYLTVLEALQSKRFIAILVQTFTMNPEIRAATLLRSPNLRNEHPDQQRDAQSLISAVHLIITITTRT